ncbi:MAG: pseudaminic acid cytidylyltransferase [Roseburia sp.]|jgi:pseudaminic acid cytidylyltransferase|nr:pseudaminic acid cytidylyltransferase [Roseburia sp.]
MKLAVITARGGSKRIPRKNIKNFCGEPIISYSIKAALESGLFDEVMVSTDDEEIAEIAKRYGASVPFMRSAETSNDFATTSDVLDEVISEYKKRGKTFEYFACIYPTAPFVTPEKLIRAYQMLTENDTDSVLPVVQFSYPPQRAVIKNGDYVVFQYIENRYTRSQDLDPIYHDCGQFYFFKTEKFVEQHDLVLTKTLPFYINELEVQDIDNITDWEIAELKYKLMVRKHDK